MQYQAHLQYIAKFLNLLSFPPPPFHHIKIPNFKVFIVILGDRPNDVHSC